MKATDQQRPAQAPLTAPKSMAVKGRHMFHGMPVTVTITDHEVRPALEKPVRRIVQAVRVADDPLSSVVLGAGEMLGDMALLRRVSAA